MHLRRLLVRWVYANLWGLDCWSSALFFGRPGETWSARFGRWREQKAPWGTALADALDRVVLLLFRQPNHCAAALAAFIARETASPWSE